LVKPHAFVVAADGVEAGDALEAEIQAWVRERLEPYKYPRRVRFLEEFPRTHLGKVDRGKLARG
jgi:acyl-coenzyme A synthetase/AMP-(fatty) acid ligase